MLSASLGEAWPSWSPQVVSIIVHDATLPLGCPSVGDRYPGCVARGRCPRCVAGRPHAYFATISYFDFLFFLADDVISTSYYVHIRVRKVFELVPIPRFCCRWAYPLPGYVLVRYRGPYLTYLTLR